MRSAFLQADLYSTVRIRVFLCIIKKNLDDLLQVLFRAMDSDAICDIVHQCQPLFEKERIEGKELIGNKTGKIDALQWHFLDRAIIDTRELKKAFHQATHLLRHREDVLGELFFMRLIEAR